MIRNSSRILDHNSITAHTPIWLDILMPQSLSLPRSTLLSNKPSVAYICWNNGLAHTHTHSPNSGTCCFDWAMPCHVDSMLPLLSCALVCLPTCPGVCVCLYGVLLYRAHEFTFFYCTNQLLHCVPTVSLFHPLVSFPLSLTLFAPCATNANQIKMLGYPLHYLSLCRPPLFLNGLLSLP